MANHNLMEENRKIKVLGLSAAVLATAVLASSTLFQKQDVQSGLPREECRLCGSGIQSLSVQHAGKTDSIGLINVNTWDREFEPDGTERSDTGGYMLLFGNGSGDKSSTAFISTSPDRRISTADITMGFSRFPDRGKMCRYLCDACMLQVENLNAPCDFILYDFYTGGLHGIGNDVVGFAARDYWIEIVEGKSEFKILTVYAPVSS